MRLQEIADLFVTAQLTGRSDTEITGLCLDSREASDGALYICITGNQFDGHQFAAEAVVRGAAAVVTERVLDITVPQLLVKDSKRAVAAIAAHYYNQPSEKLHLIGVTGTNGKTTVTYLIEQILSAHNRKTGVIGTIEMRYSGSSYPMSRTTPHAIELQRCLSNMSEAGMEYCAMEVSSHALEQGRVMGCRFRTAVFTNLSQDHLDYHETMEKYAEAKGLLFARLGNQIAENDGKRAYAVINSDDKAYTKFAYLTGTEIVTYGIGSRADVRAGDLRMSGKGTEFVLHTFKGAVSISLPLAGRFNVYNALAAAAAALIEGVDLLTIKSALENAATVPGRIEAVDAGQSFTVLVDYAHTPDGLDNVLAAIKQFAQGKIITVFGCGGDRDPGKRPLMGKIAAKYADFVIITSDNPRSEAPFIIMEQISDGCKAAGICEKKLILIEDRRQAIKKAVEIASPSDVVLIAGKGHETSQIINGVSYPFDDRLVAKEAIRGL